jgi:hypothetical protein
VIGSLDDNLLDKLTSSVTDSTARSLVNAAFPRVEEILTRERNRLAEALLSGLPWLAAAAVDTVLTYYTAPDKLWKTVGYSSSAILAGTGGVMSVLGLQTPQTSTQDAQGKSSALDPYVEQASKQLVTQAEPKVRAIIDDERKRLAGALQASIPWISGGAIGAVATAFAIPDGHDLLKVVGWLIVIALVAYGAFAGLEVMRQKALPQ